MRCIFPTTVPPIRITTWYFEKSQDWELTTGELFTFVAAMYSFCKDCLYDCLIYGTLKRMHRHVWGGPFVKYLTTQFCIFPYDELKNFEII